MMNRVDIETRLSQTIRGLPQEKLVELFEFADGLRNRLPLRNTQHKLSFVELIRHSPLCGVELQLDRDKSVCRTIEL